MKIGILTGGGDCPGLNPVIRAAVKTSLREGYQAIGIRNGWKGLVENDTFPLDAAAAAAARRAGWGGVAAGEFLERTLTRRGLGAPLGFHCRVPAADSVVFTLAKGAHSLDNALFGH